jgi:hypothetical protein
MKLFQKGVRLLISINLRVAQRVPRHLQSSTNPPAKMSPALTDSVAVEAPIKQNTVSPPKRHEEYQYLDLVREILDDGEHRPDRLVVISVQSD